MENQASKYWVNQAVETILQERPEGEIVLSSGHSPSGRYHVGLLREFVSVNGIMHKLQERGRQATHLDFVDDFDKLRKVPAGVPEEFSKYLGMPLYLAPDPIGKCHDSYADHYFDELSIAVKRAGIEPKVVRSHQEYLGGTFTQAIEQALSKTDQAKEIIEKVSKRQVPADYSPVQLLSDNQRLDEWQFAGWDQKKQVVFWRDAAGAEGELDYTKGRVKLDWRLDWPARWSIWNVGVEPFGRDHASAGGSFATGKELVKQIFGGRAPYPVPYDFINITGQTKKMSKSAGNVITPGEALDVMPPEIMRYFVLKARPNKLLFFDPGIGMYNTIDEFSKVESAVRSQEPNDFADAYHLAVIDTAQQTISSVSFSHLVQVYQAARGDTLEVLEILRRTGYESAVKNEREVIERELEFVKNWLAKYAPDSVKFEVQDKLPKTLLEAKQEKFLTELSGLVYGYNGEIDGQVMHDLIYEAKEVVDIEPAQAFKAIYQVVLAKDHGPKAGWFLASLDRDWLVKRLRLEA